MNTAELADHIAADHSMNKSQAKQVVEAVFAAIVEAASKGEEVSLPGFGKFKVAARDARQGRNPATGETIQIAASKKLGFTPAKQVKDAMNPASPAGKSAAKPVAKAKAKRA
jgi:DNA-binding protein HU-beta